jgi:hypothetical protein
MGAPPPGGKGQNRHVIEIPGHQSGVDQISFAKRDHPDSWTFFLEEAFFRRNLRKAGSASLLRWTSQN